LWIGLGVGAFVLFLAALGTMSWLTKSLFVKPQSAEEPTPIHLGVAADRQQQELRQRELAIQAEREAGLEAEHRRIEEAKARQVEAERQKLQDQHKQELAEKQLEHERRQREAAQQEAQRREEQAQRRDAERQAEERRQAAIQRDHDTILHYIKTTINRLPRRDEHWTGPYKAISDGVAGRLYGLEYQARIYMVAERRMLA
jgi:hypothetical protein